MIPPLRTAKEKVGVEVQIKEKAAIRVEAQAKEKLGVKVEVQIGEVIHEIVTVAEKDGGNTTVRTKIGSTMGYIEVNQVALTMIKNDMIPKKNQREKTKKKCLMVSKA